MPDFFYKNRKITMKDRFRVTPSVQYQPLRFWVLYILICYLTYQFHFYLKTTQQHWSFDLMLFNEWLISLIHHPIDTTDAYVNIFTLIMMGYVLVWHWIGHRKVLIINYHNIYWSIGKFRISQTFQLNLDTKIQYIQIPPHEPTIHLIRLKNQHQEFTINLEQFESRDREEIQQRLQIL